MTSFADLAGAPGAALDVPDDLEEANEVCRARGWTDGLPIIPPTEERVLRMLGYCDRPWDAAIAKLPPRWGEVTPLRIAANAVMAGCRPEYLPLVILALEAMCEQPFNLYGIQATTHPCAPLVIVNGPIARELEINASHNAFGPGVQSNATIGRAIRLALINIGGAIPRIGDMATIGSPAKYTYCVAENEAESPWEPLHVERGFARETTTVTVFAAEGPHNINDHESTTAVGILKMVAGTMAITGANDVYYTAQPLVVFGPEHAATVAHDGYSKADVRRFLFEQARLPLGSFSRENIDRRFRVEFAERFANAGIDALVPVVQRAEDIAIIVLGGAGKHSAYIPTFGGTRSVTRALIRADGEPARSMDELRVTAPR
jgi:hypothetical protein